MELWMENYTDPLNKLETNPSPSKATLRQQMINHIEQTKTNERLFFYATGWREDRVRSNNDFIHTAYVDTEGFRFTPEGQAIRSDAGESGLFPNRFRQMEGKLLRIGIVVEPPFVIAPVVNGTFDLSEVHGMIIDIVNIMADRFNFTYEFLLSSDGEYGGKNPNGSWTGLIRDLLEKRIDLAAGPLSYNQERAEAVRLIGPFWFTSTALVAQRGSTDRSVFKMLRPFEPIVWVTIMLAVIVSGLVMYILNHFSPFSAWNLGLPGAKADEVSLIQNIWSITGSMVSQGFELYPLALSPRTTVIFFWVTVLVIQATWQADMTAFMSRSFVRPAVESLSELAYSTFYQPVAVPGSSIISWFRTGGSDPVSSILYEKLLRTQNMITSASDAIQLLNRHPKYVFIHDRHVIDYMIAQNCQKLQRLPVQFDPSPCGFALSYGSDFERPFDLYLNRMYETGTVDRLYQKWWFGYEVCKDNEAQYKTMTLQDTFGAAIILLVAAVLGVFILCLELVYFKFLRKVKWFRRKPKEGNVTLIKLTEVNGSRRPSCVTIDLLPETVANEFRYGGRRRASCAYNAHLIQLNSSHNRE